MQPHTAHPTPALWHLWISRLWLPVLGALLALAVEWSGMLRPIDNALFDAWQRRSEPVDASAVLIAAIDAPALARHGAWPWPRERQLELLNRLLEGGATVVVLAYPLDADANAPQTEADALLWTRVRENDRIVIARDPQMPAWHDPVFTRHVPAQRTGHMLLNLDPDGVQRTLQPQTPGEFTQGMHLALATAQRWLAATRRHDTLRAPRWPREPVRIDMGSPSGLVRVSAAEVLSGALAQQDVAGRVVIVGPTPPGLAQRVPTPSERRDGLDPLELLARQILAAASGRWLIEAPLGIRLLASMPLSLLMIGVLRAITPVAAAPGVAMMLTIPFAWTLLMRPAGIWWPFTGSGCAIVGCALIWGWIRLIAADRTLMREMRAGVHQFEPLPWLAWMNRARLQLARIDRLRELAHREMGERDDAIRYITHDLRSPLGSAMQAVSALRQSPPERVRAELAQVYRTLGKVLQVVDHFQTVATLQPAGLRDAAPVDLNDLMEQVIDGHWQQHRPIEYQVSDAAEQAWTHAQATLLRRVFGNLLSNALRYGEAGSPILIELNRVGSFWVLAVTSRGLPVSDHDALAIFSTRHRSHEAMLRVPEGQGFGLAICSQIARLHGGDLRLVRLPLDGVPNLRSRFEVWLPVRLIGTAALPAPSDRATV